MFTSAVLNQIFDDFSYRHLDITLHGLKGLQKTPEIRFKLFSSNDSAGLEFRQLADWPKVFDSWPSDQTDHYGDIYKISVDKPFDVTVLSARERSMLTDLAGSLQGAIQAVASDLTERELFLRDAMAVKEMLGAAATYSSTSVTLPNKPAKAAKAILPMHSSNEALPEYVRKVLAEFETVNLTSLRVSARPLPNRWNPIVISVVKNECDRLFDFFRHYREAGIERFCFIDNGSTDGTLEYLLAQPDVDVFCRLGKFDWMLKQGWINRAVHHYGLDRWFMYLDADEHVVFDGLGERTFADLTLLMEAQDIHRVRGFLVDMYADCPLLDSTYAANAMLRHAYPFFDTDTYKEEHYKEIISVKGGPRPRVFSSADASFRPEMTKYPLFCAKPDEYMVNPHHLWPYEHNFASTRYLAIMHFKFLPGILNKIRTAIEAKNYWDGSLEYKCYLTVIDKDPEISMMGSKSARFNGIEDFVLNKMIASVPWDSKPSSYHVMQRAFRQRRAALDGLSGYKFSPTARVA